MRRRKRNLKNAAATTMPAEPGRVTINNQGPAWGTIIFSLLAAFVVVLIILWNAGVFLLDRAGVRHPEEALAGGVLNFFLIGVIVFVASIIARWFLVELFATLRYRMDVQLEMARVHAVKAQELPATTGGRMTGEERRKFRAVMAVMGKAYSGMIDPETGELRTRVQPWSRRSVGSIKLLNESEPVGEHTVLASWVKQWLLDKGILADDKTVNVKEFPGLAAVQMVLIEEFGMPINLGNASGSMSPNYVDKAGGESWG